MAQPQEENRPTPQTNPSQPGTPGEDQILQPRPDTEVNPGMPGTNTEVDLDREKINTYPGGRPPERH